MRKKNYKGRCIKKSVSKAKDVCRTYDEIQLSYLDVLQDILGKDYIFSRKPNPAYVCVGFAEEEIRKDLTETSRLADRIHLEAILKDTHTVENHPEKLHRWVEIAREILG